MRPPSLLLCLPSACACSHPGVQWGLYAGLAAESAVDLIVAVSQCLLLRKFQTGIRRWELLC